MTNAPNVVPFPVVSEDEAHKAGMVKAFEELVEISLRNLAKARQELAEARPSRV